LWEGRSGGSKIRQGSARKGSFLTTSPADHEVDPATSSRVKSQIQGDAVRVSGKSRDDLQRVIGRLRELDEVVPLQFQNYR
jgi:hypothetical protein